MRFLTSDRLMAILDKHEFAKPYKDNKAKHSLADWNSGLQKYLPSFGINSPKRVAAFLGQTMYESAGFTLLEENLHYSAKGLQGVFGLSEEEANAIAGDTVKIGNKVYGEGRRAQILGNTEPGDGYKFRGRGIIQLTGRSNYTACSKGLFTHGLAPSETTLLDDPDLLIREAGLAVASAAWFWSTRNKDMNTLADQSDETTDGEAAYHTLTRQVNTAQVAFDKRYAIFKTALTTFAAATV